MIDEEEERRWAKEWRMKQEEREEDSEEKNRDDSNGKGLVFLRHKIQADLEEKQPGRQHFVISSTPVNLKLFTRLSPVGILCLI